MAANRFAFAEPGFGEFDFVEFELESVFRKGKLLLAPPPLLARQATESNWDSGLATYWGQPELPVAGFFGRQLKNRSAWATNLLSQHVLIDLKLRPALIAFENQVRLSGNSFLRIIVQSILV